jgi:hypothetical protein
VNCAEELLERAIVHQDGRGNQVVHLHQFSHERLEDADQAEQGLTRHAKFGGAAAQAEISFCVMEPARCR